MEALWNLEDKWKVSTQKAIALFSCISISVIAICVVTALKRRSKCRQKGVNILNQEPCGGDVSAAELPVHRRWDSVKKALMGSVRWSGLRKWEEEGYSRGSQRETPTPLLVGRNLEGLDVGWQSHNSTSAVWQRPILMGEKCELPRFSGLILYDQRGMPLHQCEEESNIHIQEKQPVKVERTTLKNLL
ncbi:uncharacterized protein LOC142527655 [Primulina tabacum]|uniref:uncharacterized protein LOC142527655 n=1 Tax=Primulina tabacum TaxID=48773 RepID=UPI003F5A3389